MTRNFSAQRANDSLHREQLIASPAQLFKVHTNIYARTLVNSTCKHTRMIFLVTQGFEFESNANLKNSVHVRSQMKILLLAFNTQKLKMFLFRLKKMCQWIYRLCCVREELKGFFFYPNYHFPGQSCFVFLSDLRTLRQNTPLLFTSDSCMMSLLQPFDSSR